MRKQNVQIEVTLFCFGTKNSSKNRLYLGEFLYPTITHQSCRPSNRVKRLLAAISVSTAMFTKMWKMPSGRDIAKEYQSRSRWLKQLNATVNGGADSHEDY